MSGEEEEILRREVSFEDCPLGKMRIVRTYTRVRIASPQSPPADISDSHRQAVIPAGAEEYYGRNFGSETWILDKEELEALMDGKLLARDINGEEYTCFLRVRDE